MKYVAQPHTTEHLKHCGQACLAMVLEKDLDSVVKRLPFNGTKTKQLRKYLETRKYKTSHNMKRFRGMQSLPEMAICRLSYRGRNGKFMTHQWHWIVWAKGRFWDPWDESKDTYDKVIGIYGAAITSFMEIYKA